MEKRPDLDDNKNTIIKYIAEAKQQGCDLVVFPEDALSCDQCSRDSLYIKRLSGEIEEIRRVIRENHIYTVFCVKNLFKSGESFKNSMYAVDENGEIAKIYNKLWDQKNYTFPPGTIMVKGIRIGLTLCSDRWIRSTTDLPQIDAPVNIECSWSKLDTVYFRYGPIEGIRWWEIRKPDGTFLDCSPTLGPYWIPRAIRNHAYIICSGRRASIVYPDGKTDHCPDKSEQLLVRKIDLSGLVRENATARFKHPLFRAWWDLGIKIINGEKVEDADQGILVSEPKELVIALAQIAISDDIKENLRVILKNISEAKAGNADIVVFPALSITGRPQTKSRFRSDIIQTAIEKIRKTAMDQKIYVVVGSAWKEGGDLYNSAFVIDDSGNLITRYDQLSADNILFSQGKSTFAMWFTVKNVHGAITVGNDLRWEEIAELTAYKGAQILINIADDNFGKYEDYFKQSFSTFNTFTVIVNAAEDSEKTSTGNSRVFNDLCRPENKYHAELILEADGQQGLFYVKGTMESKNPWLNKMKSLNKSMIPWFNYGTKIIYSGRPSPQ